MVLVINKKTKKSDIDSFLKKVDEKNKKKYGFNPDKYLNKIKAFDDVDPVKLQRQWRDEQ